MEFRVKECPYAELPTFIPQYQYNQISDWENFIDPIYRGGYVHKQTLENAIEYIQNVELGKFHIEVFHKYKGERNG